MGKSNESDYDNFISLGFNCETSFRIEFYFGKLNSMPFSWSFVEDKKKFPKIIESLDEFLLSMRSNDVCYDAKSKMISFPAFGLRFHPRMDILFKDGEITKESFSLTIDELSDRLNHLRDKFENLFVNGENTLFILKIKDFSYENDIGYIGEVYDALQRKMSNGSFSLLVVLEKKDRLPLSDMDGGRNIYFRYLKRYAPQKYSDTLGDISGWNKILKEFSREKSKTYYRVIYLKRFKRFYAAISKRINRVFLRK